MRRSLSAFQLLLVLHRSQSRFLHNTVYTEQCAVQRVNKQTLAIVKQRFFLVSSLRPCHVCDQSTLRQLGNFQVNW